MIIQKHANFSQEATSSAFHRVHARANDKQIDLWTDE
jgi:hypothetical protein